MLMQVLCACLALASLAAAAPQIDPLDVRYLPPQPGEDSWRFTEDLKAHLAEHGFDPLMGARPMARLIQDTIRRALADELLFGRLVSGGKVTIDLDDEDKVKLVFADDTPVEPPVVQAG